MDDKLYSFVMKGELTKSALKKTGYINKYSLVEENYYKSLPIDLLDEDILLVSKNMSVVYITIATFENMVRDFIKKILIDEYKEEWYTKGISDNILKTAKSRQRDEERIKWHTPRGGDIMDYIDFGDLHKIILKESHLFNDYIISVEWAKTIFETLSKSRNVIMHSGVLSKEDVERVGMNIRDWIRQVGY